jgi:hypothetical protein
LANTMAALGTAALIMGALIMGAWPGWAKGGAVGA